MPRALSIAVFATVALGLVGAVHFYIWARLVGDVGLAPLARALGTGVVVALFLSLPASFFLTARLPAERARGLLLVTYSWMGVMFLLLVLLAAGDLLRAGAVSIATLAGARPNAAGLLNLARVEAVSVASIAALLTVFAMRSALGDVRVRTIEVALPGLPAAQSGTTLVQLSDIHAGPTLGREFIERIVQQTNQLEPDVVAITGDLVDGSVAHLADHVAPLAQLKARHGVYFVTGNHEYYSGAEAWCTELRRLGVRVLRNERVSIGDGGASYDLAGIDDHSAARFGHGHGADLPRALEGRDANRALVLMAHQPRAIAEAEQLGVGLQLSGHTHGGQIWPFYYFVFLQQPVVSGLKRIGRSLVYVSNGTGYWGPPMRLGAPAEITRFVLLAEAHESAT
jgi:uncharacterized protein